MSNLLEDNIIPPRASNTNGFSVSLSVSQFAEKKRWEILAVEVMPDHIHLFVSVPPTIAPCEVVKTFKGQSGRHFLMQHPEFTDPRYDNALWVPLYFVASAGDVSSETIKAYIEGQYD